MLRPTIVLCLVVVFVCLVNDSCARHIDDDLEVAASEKHQESEYKKGDDKEHHSEHHQEKGEKGKKGYEQEHKYEVF